MSCEKSAAGVHYIDILSRLSVLLSVHMHRTSVVSRHTTILFTHVYPVQGHGEQRFLLDNPFFFLPEPPALAPLLQHQAGLTQIYSVRGLPFSTRGWSGRREKMKCDPRNPVWIIHSWVWTQSARAFVNSKPKPINFNGIAVVGGVAHRSKVKRDGASV